MTEPTPLLTPPPHHEALPPPRKKRSRTWIVGLLLLLAVGGAAWWMYQDKAAAKPNKHNQTVPVTLATISKGDIDVTDPALGTVTPIANVTVRTQINGVLEQVGFDEGQIVHKDDFLAQIDDRPYKTALEQANGALHRDQALLKEAQIDLDRYTKLLKQDSIAKQQVDTQTSLVQQYQGDTVTDQGQIDAANVNIAYCHILAPITGRVGLRQVDAGNYVQTSDTNGLVVLTQLDPISAIFTLPEDQLPAVMKQLAAGQELQVTAFDRAQTTQLAVGKLVSVDNEINTSTGTVKLRAQFDNPENQLFPNQFVNIQVRVDTLHDVVLAPQAAILRGTPGTFVYLAKDDGTVAVQTVKLGVSQADNVEIVDGLKEGDKVVTDGTDKLRDGAPYKLPDQNNANGGDAKKHEGKKNK